jgi:hypothetical protein
MNEAMQKLIDAVQKASPVVWQAAYRQVWVELMEALLCLVIFIVAGFVLLRFAKRAQVTGPYDDGELTKIGLWAGTVLSFVISFFLCGEVIGRIANPTFQAIKNLKGLL